jgi:hypothetical protein
MGEADAKGELRTARPTNQYLRFEEFRSPSGKTLTVHVMSASRGEPLGSIGWYGPWRQYTFRPCSQTIWNTSCLDTIQAYIAALMEERRRG